MAKNILRIPHYLIANTKDELIRLMLKNNVDNDKEYGYFDIQKEGSQWVAWYYDSIKPIEDRNAKQSSRINRGVKRS
jgi:hypothetical protein